MRLYPFSVCPSVHCDKKSVIIRENGTNSSETRLNVDIIHFAHVDIRTICRGYAFFKFFFIFSDWFIFTPL